MPKRGYEVSTVKRRAAFIERLRAVGPGPECITWPWTTKVGTYPVIRDPADGRTTTVHRWVYEQIIGPLGDLEACHSCDNPPCVRPSHLWAGTHGQNLRDAYRKGRKKITTHARPGEQHHNARLTVGDVYAIRRLASEGVAHRVIGLAYGVSRPTVTQIHIRRRWRHLSEESDQPTPQPPAVQA